MTKVYKNGVDFLESYREADIVFMDIQMPFMNGMDVAKILREKDKQVYLVFVTNMANLAAGGYKVDAIDFIVKPIEYGNFVYCINKIVALLNRSKRETIMLTSASGSVRINVRDIYYIEAEKHNVLYHTASGVFSERDSLVRAEAKISGIRLARPYSAFSVNLNYVEQIRDGEVCVKGDWLPISRAKRKEFMDALTAFIGQGDR